MKLATIPSIDGTVVETTHGVVTGHAVLGAHVLKDFAGKLRDFFGGRSLTYEKVLGDGEEVAVKNMVVRAKEVGANAIVGIRFDYEVMSFDGQMLLIMCAGTAVTLRSRDGSNFTDDAESAGQASSREAAGPARRGGGAVPDHDPEPDPAQEGRYARDVDAELRERMNRDG